MRNVWFTGAIAALFAAGIAVAADTKDKDKKAEKKPEAKATVAPKPTDKANEKGIILQNQGGKGATTAAPKSTSQANEKGIILQNQGTKGSDKAIILQNQGAKAPPAKTNKAVTPGS